MNNISLGGASSTSPMEPQVHTTKQTQELSSVTQQFLAGTKSVESKSVANSESRKNLENYIRDTKCLMDPVTIGFIGAEPNSFIGTTLAGINKEDR